MNDVLMVMNPRRIGPVIQALDELDIPQIRVIGYTEKEIETAVFPKVMEIAEQDSHDWLWIVSDDAIVRPYALDAVRELAKADVSPCVTGYSQRTHDNWIVNLTKSPLASPHPGASSYEFYSYAEVVSFPAEAVPTFFAGMSLTGMPLDLWRRFPFACYGGSGADTGYSSDYSLSWRLQQNGIPITAARESFAYHWRADWVSTNNDEDQSPQFTDKRIELT